MTIDELAKVVAALQQRVALLELRCGYADDVTIADLPRDVAAASLGTNPADLSVYTEAAKKKRAEEAGRL